MITSLHTLSEWQSRMAARLRQHQHQHCRINGLTCHDQHSNVSSKQNWRMHRCLVETKVPPVPVLQTNLTICTPWVAWRALTCGRLATILWPLSLETSSKHHALSVASPQGSEESVRIVLAAESGWVVARIGLPGAKVRRAMRDGAEGWIVEQPLRKLLQWSQWFGSRRHGIDAETEAARCKDKWDIADSTALLVRGDYSATLLCSIDEARKCGELEARTTCVQSYAGQGRRSKLAKESPRNDSRTRFLNC